MVPLVLLYLVHFHLFRDITNEALLVAEAQTADAAEEVAAQQLVAHAVGHG